VNVQPAFAARRSGAARYHRSGFIRSALIGVGFTAVVVILLLWLAGFFQPKIGGTHAPQTAAPGRPVADARLVPVRLAQIPASESAVGTIRAVHETAIASKILAKVEQITVQAGQNVAAGEVLVQLDDQDLQARLRQAEAAVDAAEAARRQAEVEFERVDRLYQNENATRIEWERTRTELETAEAQLEQARQRLAETQTNLDYATIRSPITGRVVDKLVEVGDTVSPGQPLLTLYDPERMQLVARVRESLAQRLDVGQKIPVRIDALDLECHGTISEIVPEAEATSRTFSVKVTGPCPEGVYSGMFGRMYVPLDAEQVLLIPRAAVRQVGQLTLVDVAAPGAGEPDLVLRRRVVQLGRAFADDVEVLAGLQPGEEVAVTPTTTEGA
jgi:RND family efflux transporter MFP subunit